MRMEEERFEMFIAHASNPWRGSWGKTSYGPKKVVLVLFCLFVFELVHCRGGNWVSLLGMLLLKLRYDSWIIQDSGTCA